MWDVILGWTFSILGGLALGVIGNLLTPKAQAVWAWISISYRDRRALKLLVKIERYKFLKNSNAVDTSVMITLANYIVGMAIVIFLSIISVNLMIFYVGKNTYMTDEGVMEWLHPAPKRNYSLVYLYTFTLLMSTIMTGRAMSFLFKATDLHIFNLNPELYERNALKKIGKSKSGIHAILPSADSQQDPS